MAYCRSNLRAVLNCVAVLLVIVELGGIWNEVRQMRSEQVKNSLYALPKERRDTLKGTSARRRLESSSYVDGEVSVNGSVEVDQPIAVEIER